MKFHKKKHFDRIRSDLLLFVFNEDKQTTFTYIYAESFFCRISDCQITTKTNEHKQCFGIFPQGGAPKLKLGL